jgi:RimJ/RimL family protein N-acetyltransferase
MFRPTYPLTTERLLLRPFTDEDFDSLYAMHSRADVTRYLYWGPRTADEVREMLERRKRMIAIEDEGTGIDLVAALRDSERMIGHFMIQWVSREHRQGETGFVLHPDHHGRGYATEAAPVLLRLGFEGLGLHRIVGRCDARNVASARLMERLGMRREAHLRENEFIKGEWTDELVYAMLATEWEALRAVP